MHDRVVKPIDEAVFWVEYAMRHNGAIHFKSAALKLNWFQYNLVDIAVVFHGIVFMSIFIFRSFIKKKEEKIIEINGTKKKQ